MRNIAHKIHHHLTTAKNIVVVPHQNPDGDALGAATAFYEYLLLLNKKVDIFCATQANQKLLFMKHGAMITTNPAIITNPEVDTIVVLDSGDLRYAGVADLIKSRATPATIICIDHHATNEHYGHFNLVVTSSSSTCEIVYNYLRHNHIVVNEKMATSLLTGLTTDTGNFSNSATSANAFLVSGELIRSGGNLNMVTDATVKNKTVDTLRLWGKVFSRLTTDKKTGITHTYITQQDLLETGVPESESEGIANFLNNLANNKIALILKETADGKIKGNFRTTHDDVDVSAMAKKLSGGGHKKAAGFTISGTITEVLNKILTME